MGPVAGDPVEHRLLGCLLLYPDTWREAREQTRGEEFSHAGLGAVFEGLCHALARGYRFDQITVEEQFAGWGARGLTDADPFVWANADLRPDHTGQYARAIRNRYLRLGGFGLATTMRTEFSDAGIPALDSLSSYRNAIDALIDGAANGDLVAEPLSRVLAEQTDVEYDWLIPGMLERTDRLILTGGEGGGKTTLLRQIALCAAAGIHPLKLARITPAKVLVIDVENNRRQWQRKAGWIVNQILRLHPPRNPAEHLHLVCSGRIDLTSGRDLATVHRLIDTVQPDLVAIGPLYKLVPRAITNDDDAAPLITGLDSLRDRGLTLLMEAHAGKAIDADGERDMRPRGSSALMGWPEFGFGLRPVRGDDKVVSLVRWRGDRDEREWPSHLVRNAPGQRLPWMQAQPDAGDA